MAALAATGRLANTYIVFASDNGYHMGEHRMLPGKYTPYETDIHVPLIVRGPGVPAGVVRSQFVGNVDLAETFADLAGVPPAVVFRRPLAQGPAAESAADRLAPDVPARGIRHRYLRPERRRQVRSSRPIPPIP